MRIGQEIECAIDEDHCEAIVLGYAGMANLTQSLSAECLFPVVDGVSVAVGLIEMLVRAGLRTSKRGGYASPFPKQYTGIFSQWQPR